MSLENVYINIKNNILFELGIMNNVDTQNSWLNQVICMNYNHYT